jgi:hypothetical protein
VRCVGKEGISDNEKLGAPGRWRSTSILAGKEKKGKNEREIKGGEDKEGVERSKLRRSRQDQGGDENFKIITRQGLTPKSTSPFPVASQ